MYSFINKEISRIEDLGLKRTLTLVEGPQGPRVSINGKDTILLCSNNYLGLAERAEVKEAAVEAVKKYGVGSGASRLVSGTMEPHVELEERIRRFKGTGAAVLFNSGYHANTGCIPMLAGRGDEIFSDRLNHASIVDACILSTARVRRFPHRDMDALERLLKGSKSKRKLIVTDGVFSMDGDIAPLKDIVGLAERFGATVFLDDAHGTGVLGRNGRGTLEHFNLNHPSVIQMGTLGKAVGTFGAFVAGSKDLVELIINRSRPFIYTTALPPALCAASMKAIDIIEEEPEIRKRLWENITYFKRGLEGIGLNTLNSETQIIPVLVGDSETAKEVSEKLLERGVFIQGIRPPTVPEGTSRLRVTIMATHTKEDLDFSTSAIKEVFDEYR